MALQNMYESPPSFWRNGPIPGTKYDFPSKMTSSSINTDAKTHSKGPITTGTSVIGIKFKDGVILAADTMASYGYLLRFRKVSRLMLVNDNIILGAGGDYADYQYLKDIIEQKVIEEQCLDDGFKMKPHALYCWLTRVLYNRRSKFDPLWNEFVIGGLENGVPYLGTVDKLGTAYEDDVIVTGFGSHLALPFLRDIIEDGWQTLTKEKALEAIARSMALLYYRDSRSWSNYEVAVITKDGTTKEEQTVKENWQYVRMIKESI